MIFSMTSLFNTIMINLARKPVNWTKVLIFVYILEYNLRALEYLKIYIYIGDAIVAFFTCDISVIINR